MSACAAPNCTNPVTSGQTYCSSACISRAYRVRRAKRGGALTCDKCGTQLLEPAALCGFCKPLTKREREEASA